MISSAMACSDVRNTDLAAKCIRSARAGVNDVVSFDEPLDACAVQGQIGTFVGG
jgi:hypothetical protein